MKKIIFIFAITLLLALGSISGAADLAGSVWDYKVTDTFGSFILGDCTIEFSPCGADGGSVIYEGIDIGSWGLSGNKLYFNHLPLPVMIVKPDGSEMSDGYGNTCYRRPEGLTE